MTASPRILVVEDVEVARQKLTLLLEQAGFNNLLLASSGEMAVDIIETQSVDLVICDWHLAYLSGIEVLSYVRSHARYSKLPFLMLTAESVRERVMSALKMGVTDYLIKPVTAAHLGEKITRALQRSPKS